MISDESDEVIEELFNLFKNRYQNTLQSMRDSEFVFDYVQLLYNKCHKKYFNCIGLYIDFPYWIRNRKAAINPINKKDNKYFQYVIAVALNRDEIKKIRKE